MADLFWNKKLTAYSGLLVLLFACLFAQFDGCADAKPLSDVVDTEKVLVFLRDVVGYDFSKYEVKLTRASTIGTHSSSGQYRLDATNVSIPSILTANFNFWDNKLENCGVQENSHGPPLYSITPPADLKESALRFLQRYQTHSGDPQISQMQNLLSEVDITVNSTAAIGDLQLSTWVKNDKTQFSWSNMFNGADYSRLRLEFIDGYFSGFSDDRSIYTLASGEVNISEQQAIQVAVDYLKTWNFTYNGANCTGLHVLEEHIRSEAGFTCKTNQNLTSQYSMYNIDLPLDSRYPLPGDDYLHTTYFTVFVWADTGKVFKCIPLGAHPIDELANLTQTTPTASPENTQTDNNYAAPSLSVSTIITTFAAVAVPVALAVGVVTIKKRRK